MESASERQWITLQAQHRLGVSHLVYDVSGKGLLQLQLPVASVNGPLQPMDTVEWPPEELPWAVALLAQSSAYLALELQAFAERLSDTPIRCPESTYRRLYDSIETLRRLVDAIAKSYKLSNDNGSDGFIPVLSERLVGEIRSMLAVELVNGSGGSTINTARVGTNRSADAGGMR
jgi:hypothetical protein